MLVFLSLLITHHPPTKVYLASKTKLVFFIPNASSISSGGVYYVFQEKPPSSIEEGFYKKLEQKGMYFFVSIEVPPAERGKKLYYRLFYTTLDGKSFFYPEKGFFSSSIEEDPFPPKIHLVEPRDEKIEEKEEITLRYVVQDRESRIDPSSFRLYLNGVEYTSSLRKGNNQVFLVLKRLPPGKYTHKLVVKDRAGNQASLEGSFEVIPFQEKAYVDTTEEDWKDSGSFSFSYDSSLSLANERDWRSKEFERNSRKSFQAEYKDLIVRIGPLILSKAEQFPGTRQNKFSFFVGSKFWESEWGDIQASISPWTLSSPLTGGYVGFRTKKWQLKLAGGETLLGYEPEEGGRSGRFSRNGLGVLGKYFWNKNLSFYVAMQNSEDVPSSIHNSTGLIAYKNRSAEVGGESYFPAWSLRVKMQYGISVNQGKGENIYQEQQGYAYKLSLSHQYKKWKLNSKLSYTEISPNFVLLNGSSQTADQRRVELQFQLPIWRISYSNQNFFSHDNLRKQRPQTSFQYGSVNSFSLRIPKLPSFYYTYSVFFQRSTPTPLLYLFVATETHNGGMSYMWDLLLKQNFSLSFTYSFTQDRSIPPSSGDLESIGSNLSYQVFLSSFWNIGWNYSFNRNLSLSRGSTTLSYSYSLINALSLFGGKMKKTLSLSKDLSYDNKTLSSVAYSIGLTLSLTLFKGSAFSLGANYSTSQNQDLFLLYPGTFSASFQYTQTF